MTSGPECKTIRRGGWLKESHNQSIRTGHNMKRIFLLTLSALALAANVKADTYDDEATIQLYLHDSGYTDISAEQVAKIHDYMKTHGIKHVCELGQ